MSVAVPTTHSSQLDVQKKKVRIREGVSSSARYLTPTYNAVLVIDWSKQCCSLLQLSMDQRCNIATRELDELRERMQRDQDEAQINYDNLRVSIHYYASYMIVTFLLGCLGHHF